MRALGVLLPLLLLAGCGGEDTRSPEDVTACLEGRGKSVEMRHMSHVADSPIASITGLDGGTLVAFYVDEDEAKTGAELMGRRLIGGRGSSEAQGSAVIFVPEGDPDPAAEECL